ncbi:MAG: response regulator transcription factor [Verrucomicrobiae bacterium]|nr:response regulator transcription factor [Verrucomicrobiae bacterium]
MKEKVKTNSQDSRRRVFIVDDHPLVCHGVKQILNQESDLVFCGGAEDAAHALKEVKALKPDVVIVDLSLKSGNGLELIMDLTIHCPGTRILVVSMHDETLYAERALRAGAHGYLMKEEAGEKVLTAIRHVLKGETYLSEKMTREVLSRLTGHERQPAHSVMESLSNRELQVFQLLGRGYAPRQIADTMHLSVKTVETYREHIKAKLGLKDASQTVQFAIQWVHSQAETAKT